jgi:hypothetical protein
VPPLSTLSGTYIGEAMGSFGEHSYSGEIRMRLSQQKDRVSGTWSGDQGAAGTITASLRDATNLTAKITQSAPCDGSFTGSATLISGGAAARGSYSGTCGSAKGHAVFVVVREKD